MATSATIGYGAVFQRATTLNGPFTYVTVGECTNPPGYNPSKDIIDATHLESPNRYREKIGGLKDGGEFEVPVNFIPESQAWVDALYASGATWTFRAFLNSPATETPIDDKMTATFGYTINGQPAWTTATVPVNTLRPAISGVAQAGQLLTAYEGNWNVGGAYTYQWQEFITATWTNIAGATGRTLVTPGGATIGRSIRVQVRLTNAGGGTTADSVGTVPVIA
jgi:hypothetical protein